MPGMVERVARAICCPIGCVAGPRRGPCVSKTALPSARAAIEAMREPTPEMVEAAYEAFTFPETDLERGYTAMIDAALKEGS
jgi:hypothetical protein